MNTCTLRRIQATNELPNLLRSQEIVGHFQNEPTVGKCFVMFAAPFVEGADIRLVQTSPIINIVPTVNLAGNQGFRFTTQNSVYELEVGNGS